MFNDTPNAGLTNVLTDDQLKLRAEYFVEQVPERRLSKLGEYIDGLEKKVWEPGTTMEEAAEPGDYVPEWA